MTTVLIGTQQASVMLGVTPQAVHAMRVRGALKPVKRRPFRFALSIIEALRVERAKNPRRGGRPSHGVELVQGK